MIIPLRAEASWNHRPYGTWLLMAVNILVHVLWTNPSPASVEPWTLDFQHLNVMQWLTSAFLHGDWLHLIGNMIFLWVFGQVVEDLTGRWYIPLYIFLAMASGCLEQVILLSHGEVGHALGASSAIYGLVTLALLWSPETRISTFIWFGLSKPSVRDVRVFWIAIYYIAWEVLIVFITDAVVSSSFLHFCGIVVAIPAGLLFLRERWVQTDGLDLITQWMTSGMSPAAAAAYRAQHGYAAVDGVAGGSGNSAALPPVVLPEQLERLRAALANGQHRISVAAYEVLRQEHPDHPIASDLLMSLAFSFYMAHDHHRALSVLRLVAQRNDLDSVRAWLKISLIQVFHLDQPLDARDSLARVQPEGFSDAELAEYQSIQERIDRRLRTVRQTAPATTRITAPATTRTMAKRSVNLLVVLWLFATARLVALENPHQVYLNQHPDCAPKRGLVTLPYGASLRLPNGYVYLGGRDAWDFIGVDPVQANGHPIPEGVIISEGNLSRPKIDFDSLSPADATRAMDEAEEALNWCLMVQWEGGWVEPNLVDVKPAAVLDLLRLQVGGMSRSEMRGTGMEITLDGWDPEPELDAKRGIVTFGVVTRIQQRLPNGLAGGQTFGQELVLTDAHLAKLGTLKLTARGDLRAKPLLKDLLLHLREGIEWDASAGYRKVRSSDTPVRAGGIQALILGKDESNSPDSVEHRFTTPWRYGWLLWATPMAIAGAVLWKRRNNQMASRAATNSTSQSCCAACGSVVLLYQLRCAMCGTSQVRR